MAVTGGAFSERRSAVGAFDLRGGLECQQERAKKRFSARLRTEMNEFDTWCCLQAKRLANDPA